MKLSIQHCAASTANDVFCRDELDDDTVAHAIQSAIAMRERTTTAQAVKAQTGERAWVFLLRYTVV